jgi:hypothetical protein
VPDSNHGTPSRSQLAPDARRSVKTDHIWRCAACDGSDVVADTCLFLESCAGVEFASRRLLEEGGRA